jgi:hypothetical protein
MAAMRFMVGRLIKFVAMAWPFVLKALYHAFELMLLSFISYADGARNKNRELAAEWRSIAVNNRFPQNLQTLLERVIYVVAVMLNIVGLILLSHVVVIVVWWIF